MPQHLGSKDTQPESSGESTNNSPISSTEIRDTEREERREEHSILEDRILGKSNNKRKSSESIAGSPTKWKQEL